MFRIIAFAVILLTASISSAGDLLSIVFEDSTIVSNGESVTCDLYYILLGDNGSLERGELIQLTQRPDDRQHFSISKGRFTTTASLDRMTIYWPATEGQKAGSVEKAWIKKADSDSTRLSYEIYQHDDKSQVGQKLRARIVDFEQLPEWVRSATCDSIVARMSPEQQVIYHRKQAQQLKAFSEIMEAYGDAIRTN